MMVGSHLGVVQTKYQPMKIAAAEAQWETCQPCSFSAFQIGGGAHIPVEITHIKLATTSVWHQAATRMPQIWQKADSEGVNLKADVYPYTYWASTIRVIVLDRDFTNHDKVPKAIA